MNAKQRNDIAEAVSGIVGAIALVGLVALVYTGHTTFGEAAPIIIGIVSAAGVYESGRRRGKKAQALEAVFGMVEGLASRNPDSEQSSSESSETSSTSTSGTSGNDGGREEPPSADGEYFAPKDSDSSSESGESDEQLDQLVDEAQADDSEASIESTTTDGKSPSQHRGEWLATAGYQDLRTVASQIRGINGNQSGDILRKRLRAAEPERVLEAIEKTDE